MILAAGFGTRLKPLTDTIPKALIPVHGVPMVRRIIEKLIASDIHDIIINTHSHADQIQNYFSTHLFDARFDLIHEKEILGTGGAIYNARNFFHDEESFIVHNVDIYSEINLNEMIAFHKQHQPIATLAVNQRETSRPILIDAEKNFLGKLEWWNDGIPQEISTVVHRFGFCGIHILSKNIFEFMNEGVFDVFESYRRCIEDDKPIQCFDITNSFWIDIGKETSLVECEKYLANKS